ncbi:MAG: ABC transporter substrate-binding protein [Actinomycetota bacterium]
MARIASLVPAATDVVVALGLEADLVGVSHECDHEAVAGLPRLTSSAVPAAGATGSADPATVDAEVAATLAAGDALYRTDRAQLAELAPDVVVTQGICDVCAITTNAVIGDLPPGARIVELSASSLAGLGDDVRRVAGALGAESAGHDLVADVSAALDAVRAAVAGRERRRVVTVEWGAPPFLGGHWVPELVDIAGGTDVLGARGEPSRRSSWEEILDADPDVVAFVPCGYGLDDAVAHAEELLDDPEVPLDRLRAVEAGELWAFDANRAFSRCTPGAVKAAARALSMALHPGLPDPDPADALRVRR